MKRMHAWLLLAPFVSVPAVCVPVKRPVAFTATSYTRPSRITTIKVNRITPNYSKLRMCKLCICTKIAKSAETPVLLYNIDYQPHDWSGLYRKQWCLDKRDPHKRGSTIAGTFF